MREPGGYTLYNLYFLFVKVIIEEVNNGSLLQVVHDGVLQSHGGLVNWWKENTLYTPFLSSCALLFSQLYFEFTVFICVLGIQCKCIGI